MQTGVYIGMIFSAYSFSRALFTPFFGKISDNIGRRKFILSGLVLFSVVSILYILATNVKLLIALRFFQGIGSAMVIPIVMAYIGDMSPEGKEGEYMGTFTIAFFLGMAIGPVAGGVISQYLGVNYVFVVLFIMSFINLIGLYFFLPKSDKVKLETDKETDSVLTVLRNGVVIAVVLFRFISAVGRSAFIVFFPLLADKYDISLTWIGVIITSNILTSSLLQNLFGRLADKYNKLIIIIIGNIFNITGFMLIANFSETYQFILIAILMGVGGGLAIPSSTAITTKLGRKGGMGFMMGLFNTAMGAGIAVGPIIMGLIQQFLEVEKVFYFSAIAILIGISVFTILMLIYDRDFRYSGTYAEETN
jgi:multidrug resistance protein